MAVLWNSSAVMLHPGADDSTMGGITTENGAAVGRGLGAEFAKYQITPAESDFLPKPGSIHARGSRVRFPNRKAE